MVEKLKMIWQDAKQLKDERGLTLVELLVVVVILGIIAAIAVVAIGGIIENSKKDAMVADAKQMVSAAKLYVASNEVGNGAVIRFVGTTGTGELDAKNMIDTMKDPFGSNYNNGVVYVTKGSDNKYTYKVWLDGAKDIGTAATDAGTVASSGLKKDSVN
ncbi:prepilin-type N-terminal cleavage/methylation domain-containing protein [Exiguobacterium profundum]|uniref:prepilin-type N-terminal cleavage/methylation domain-containing protein n=1 Tax=Exiguobacterium TaxID=33986 RepID=UPI0018C3C4E7|nr:MULTISPECIES: prepilin-type N-terminal cleavage/methylation domain-containing protein [Exiguobacterium]MBG0916479.1 prepilin-type N-terminal cleavage/methylation domain-containing protein [Exiguobacterium sp. SRB7LM]MCT4797302.1 prepilin-type N-terminal cleavage/methylation domain-containing protein [Exiguobacterium profundum]